MASMAGYNDTVTCPFNSSHVIRKQRLPLHLFKCQKNYPEIKLEKCPFNATHLIHANDLDEHVINCEDRAWFDLYKYNVVPISSHRKVHPDVLPIFVPLVVTDGENWDDDDYPTYDPQQYVQNNPIIRTLNLAPRSARKAFTEAEHLRIKKLTAKK